MLHFFIRKFSRVPCFSNRIFLSLTTALLVGCGSPEIASQFPTAKKVQPHDGIRIITLNVYNRPWERSARRAAALKTIIPTEPDILALQETATGLWLSGNPAEDFSRVLGMPFRQFWHKTNLGMLRTGLATLSRFRIVESEYREFTKHRVFDPKGFSRTRLETPHGLVDVVNVHLASTRNQAILESEFEQLATYVLSLSPAVPVIILGDFNAEDRTPVFQNFVQKLRADSLYAHLSASERHPTWSSDYRKGCSQADGEHLDYILIVQKSGGGPRLVFREQKPGQVILPTTTPSPSDHCPVFAELVFKQ